MRRARRQVVDHVADHSRPLGLRDDADDPGDGTGRHAGALAGILHQLPDPGVPGKTIGFRAVGASRQLRANTDQSEALQGRPWAVARRANARGASAWLAACCAAAPNETSSDSRRRNSTTLSVFMLRSPSCWSCSGRSPTGAPGRGQPGAWPSIATSDCFRRDEKWVPYARRRCGRRLP